MTEQLKAEAYVREQRPELMELTEGCVVKVGEYTYALDSNWKIETREYAHVNEYRVITHSFNEWTKIDENNFTIIGHPINMQDWLGVLPDHGRFSDFYWEEGDDVVIQFNRTTGQPVTEADYKAFNDIVSV